MSKKPGRQIVVPIPDTTTEARVKENGMEVELTEEDLEVIDTILADFEVVGGLYPAGAADD